MQGRACGERRDQIIDHHAPSPRQVLQALWKDLASADGTQVHRAIWSLASRPANAVTYLRTMLKPATAVDAKVITRLTKDLDSESYTERENATKEL